LKEFLSPISFSEPQEKEETDAEQEVSTDDAPEEDSSPKANTPEEKSVVKFKV